MALVCEDLARYGVVLIPPSAAEYFELLADIEHRLQARPKGAPPVDDDAISRISEHDTRGSAILINRAHTAIASIAYVWSFSGMNGRIITHSVTPGTNASVLLPFGLDDRNKKFQSFWSVVFPGSKRLMTSEGRWFGDNTDVRPAAPDELWHGGFFRSSGGSQPDRLEPLNLTLDGVFFVDGGFAGPNELGAWEQTVSAAEAHLNCAALAWDARRKGTLAEFFVEMQTLAGPGDQWGMPPPRPMLAPGSKPSDPEPIRKYEQQMVAWRALDLRKTFGDAAAIAAIAAWSDAPVPKFHKL